MNYLCHVRAFNIDLSQPTTHQSLKNSIALWNQLIFLTTNCKLLEIFSLLFTEWIEQKFKETHINRYTKVFFKKQIDRVLYAYTVLYYNLYNMQSYQWEITL